ncbi:neutral/alkaline non-lysosomal ceramidase N-terminal domain-containing protein [candidate division KSB1 bacterium]|nr:neutral/alkaline non-lysosomal ceramidase N-terminal domain-containing protein [candidate division KSB1 bacterium]
MNLNSTEFRVGTACRNITPPYPVYLYGYAARDRKSDAICEPVFLSCLSLADAQKTMLIITCDMIGIESDICQALYDILAAEMGINFPDILISCSHTHFAPGIHHDILNSPALGIVAPDERFVADFKIKLVEAARESLRNAFPAQLETTRIQIPQAVFNRRTLKSDGSVQTNFMYPQFPHDVAFNQTDHQMTVLRMKNESGVGAILLNFGCHPVTGGANHYAISSDYPFYLRQKLAEHYHCPVFFTLGAAGDTVPMNRGGECRKMIGELLGNSILLAERTYQPDDLVELKSDVLPVAVKTIFATNPDTSQAELELARDELLALPPEMKTNNQGDRYQIAARTYSQKLIARKRSLLYPDNSTQVKIQFIKIGRTTLVALPFEVLSEISLKMKTRCADSVLLSCSGGYQGYLPAAHEYPRGGYEATEWSTHFEIGTADMLLEKILSHPFLHCESDSTGD